MVWRGGGGEGRAAAARAARSLLLAVQAVEARFGRDRASERRWGERTLDIDILLFGGECIAEPGLVIPHPRLKERAFALAPLLDIAPDAREPGTGIPYRDVFAALPAQEIRLWRPAASQP